MTSTLCQSAAQGRIIALWVAKIAELVAVMVKTILSMVENVSNSLHEPGCRRARMVAAASPDMAMLVRFRMRSPCGLGAAPARIITGFKEPEALSKKKASSHSAAT